MSIELSRVSRRYAGADLRLRLIDGCPNHTKHFKQQNINKRYVCPKIGHSAVLLADLQVPVCDLRF
jgi:hypothetical protein